MPHNRPIERKLTTILAADAANYSGRMHRDEDGTVRALRAARTVIDSHISDFGGRIANTSGDGLIAEFPSVVDAVTCAIGIQSTLNAAQDHLPFRLGVHLGDVIVEGQDLLGDGVNLAARLQEMAEIGGILISQQVYDQVRRKITDVELRPLGPATPKHLQDEVGLYAVVGGGVRAPRLLDNLGPKVPAPDRAAAALPPDLPDAADAERARFVQDRKRIGSVIGIIVFVEIVADISPILTVGPVAVLGWILYQKWRKLKAVEAVGAHESTPSN